MRIEQFCRGVDRVEAADRQQFLQRESELRRMHDAAGGIDATQDRVQAIVQDSAAVSSGAAHDLQWRDAAHASVSHQGERVRQKRARCQRVRR